MSENQLQTVEPSHSIQTQKSFFNPQTFDEAARMAKALAQSTIVPKDYQGKPENCIIALEMAQRIGASVMMVMQNLYVVQGRPSWSSSFIISALNSCGRFSPIRFEVAGQGDALTCYAWAYDSRGDKLHGPTVSIDMAKKEGWFDRTGSKWKTMPEIMIRYRAAAFFGRLYAPDVLNGTYTEEETLDIVATNNSKKEIVDVEIVSDTKKEEPKSATDKLKNALKETGLPSEESVVYSREPGMEG